MLIRSQLDGRSFPGPAVLSAAAAAAPGTCGDARQPAAAERYSSLNEKTDGAPGGGSVDTGVGAPSASPSQLDPVDMVVLAHDPRGLPHSPHAAERYGRRISDCAADATLGRGSRLARRRRAMAGRARRVRARAARADLMPSALQREAPSRPERHWLVCVVPQTAQARGGGGAPAGAPAGGAWARETKRPRVPR